MFDTLRECNVQLDSISICYCSNVGDEARTSIVALIESTRITKIDVDYTAITFISTLVQLTFINLLKKRESEIDLYCREIEDETLVKLCDEMKKHGCKGLLKMK